MGMGHLSHVERLSSSQRFSLKPIGEPKKSLKCIITLHSTQYISFFLFNCEMARAILITK